MNQRRIISRHEVLSWNWRWSTSDLRVITEHLDRLGATFFYLPPCGAYIGCKTSSTGRNVMTIGKGYLSFRPELAEAIVALLVDEAHDDRHVVTITGPESFSLAELAATASEVTGDAYRYEPLDREEWIAYRRSVGRPEWSIEAGISYYDGVRNGEADVVTDDYRTLTGKEPLSIREIIALHRDEMPLSSS